MSEITFNYGKFKSSFITIKRKPDHLLSKNTPPVKGTLVPAPCGSQAKNKDLTPIGQEPFE